LISFCVFWVPAFLFLLYLASVYHGSSTISHSGFVHSIYPALASKSLFASSLINTGRFQYSGAVGISHVKTVIFCAETCKHNIKCMTFFYNTLSTECVLHSKTFRYQDPDQAENGWKMYLLTESKYYISVMYFSFI